jgi:hypothetical protein
MREWVDRLMFAGLEGLGGIPSLRRRRFIKTSKGSNIATNYQSRTVMNREWVVRCMLGTDVEFETSDVLAPFPCKHQSSSYAVIRDPARIYQCR